MTEHGILFNAPMVRALLDGSKTQTRRALKVRCQEIGERDYGSRWPWSEHPDTAADHWHACPYGQPNDRLWVRETTHRRPMLNLLTGEPLAPEYDGGAYTVDGVDVLTPDGFDLAWWYSRKSCPSIHMPRWASRILLEITGVRVERLQGISEADALAEGVSSVRTREWDLQHFPEWRHQFDAACTEGVKPPLGPLPSKSFSALWESINGAGSWAANPWVWVVEFRRVPS